MSEYTIHFKHDEHGSDELEGPFSSDVQALAYLTKVQAEPGRYGYHDWLKEATMWIQDEYGNIVHS